MYQIYRERRDNQKAFTNQVFRLFTDAIGDRTAEEFADTLYGLYTVEDFLYSDDWKYFNVLGYFQKTVVPHKIAVYQAGLELSKNKGLMSRINPSEFLDNLWIHDMSKFSANEAWGYVNMKAENKTEFNLAWHHHKQHNPHHPEHWFSVKKDGSTELLKMPRIYILEMISDWIGAGKTYGNEIQDWLPDNIQRFSFHEDTAVELAAMLQEIGFDAEPTENKVLVL